MILHPTWLTIMAPHKSRRGDQRLRRMRGVIEQYLVLSGLLLAQLHLHPALRHSDRACAPGMRR